MKNEFYKRQDLLFDSRLLEGKKIAIIGAGGLGCSEALALASTGISEIDIIDFDTVSLSNISRQVLFSFDDCGEKKAKIFEKLQNRSYAKINSFCATAGEYFLKAKNLDLILDASDNLEARKMIDKFAKFHNIPWLYTSVEGFYANFALIKNKDFPFKDEIAHIKPQTSPFVMSAASLASTLAIKYLANLEPKLDELYFLDFSNELFKCQNFSL